MMIDAHIHFDKYDPKIQELIVQQSIVEGVKGVVSVSMDLHSSIQNLELHRKYPHFVHSAYGFHPEQKIPVEDDLRQLLNWMDQHKEEMIAVGEVGLPTFTMIEARKRNEIFHFEPYVELLEDFIVYAKKINKPILLHAVSNEAEIACNLLEKHSVTKAHFHWYKGPRRTTERMAQNGYYVSVTPEILYERETQELVQHYPIQQLMVETDGPWPFEGPFLGQMTHPIMMKQTIECIASIQEVSKKEVSTVLYENTKRFFGI